MTEVELLTLSRHRFIAQRQGELFVPSYDVTAASYSRMLNYQ